MKVKLFNNVPIKYWTNDVEDGAWEQALNLSKLPFLHKHVALMPDVHQGYGMPIGGVVALKNAIIPNAVGVDIGCGVIAVKTNIEAEGFSLLKDIMGDVRKAIPVGMKHHKEKQSVEIMPDPDDLPVNSVVWNQFERARVQLGTLGGGNHFIEFQRCEDGFLWVMIHSGSRNVGYKVANYYNEVAKKLNSVWYANIPKKHDLAFLPVDSIEGQNYITEMNWCLEFARISRLHMMQSILSIIEDWAGGFIMEERINIHHNYAAIEFHYGKSVWVHRKGATRARYEESGIIPGSMGTASYIVKGLGNPESFHSCSHGAGRRMSRTQARNTLDLQNEIKVLDNAGIIHSMRNKSDLEESPEAYKDIDEVIANQKDLVATEHILKPLGVIKG